MGDWLEASSSGWAEPCRQPLDRLEGKRLWTGKRTNRWWSREWERLLIRPSPVQVLLLSLRWSGAENRLWAPPSYFQPVCLSDSTLEIIMIQFNVSLFSSAKEITVCHGLRRCHVSFENNAALINDRSPQIDDELTWKYVLSVCLQGVHPCDKRQSLSAYGNLFPAVDFSEVFLFSTLSVSQSNMSCIVLDVEKYGFAFWLSMAPYVMLKVATVGWERGGRTVESWCKGDGWWTLCQGKKVHPVVSTHWTELLSNWTSVVEKQASNRRSPLCRCSSAHIWKHSLSLTGSGVKKSLEPDVEE